ncbi:hypothetical protein STEG23_023016 [Scotinomys teguina]
MVKWSRGETDDKQQFEKPYRDATLHESYQVDPDSSIVPNWHGLQTLTFSRHNRIRHSVRKPLGMNGFIWLTCPCPNPSLEEVRTGTQGKNLEAGIATEAMLLTGLLFMASSPAF